MDYFGSSQANGKVVCYALAALVGASDPIALQNLGEIVVAWSGQLALGVEDADGECVDICPAVVARGWR